MALQFELNFRLIEAVFLAGCSHIEILSPELQQLRALISLFKV
jgi:hypothetical protein